MTTNTNAALAQLRHLYANMMGGEVRDTAQTKRMAQGLLAPAIEALEQAALTTAAAAVPAIPDAITHTIQRALVKFSDSELERLRTLLEPKNAAVAMFGTARIAAQQNIDDADAALNWLAAAPKAEPVPAGEREELREGASYESMNLAAMVLSDCGHSSNYQPLLERVAGRIDRHVERLLTAQREDLTTRAQAAPSAVAAPVAAWMTPEGDRVVTEATMAGARKDGGAMLSSMRPYTVALVRAAAPTTQAAPGALSQAAQVANNLIAVAEDQAFEAWYKQDCLVGGVNARIAARAAWNARAALTTAAVPPEGWVMVPVEPTKEMIEHANHACDGTYAGDVYRAMVSAAPKTEPAPAGEYPPLPTGSAWCGDDDVRDFGAGPGESALMFEPTQTQHVPLFTAGQMRAYVDADRAMRAQAAPQPAVQQGDDLQTFAIGDSNYAAGMLLGWNLCTAGMDAEFSRIREDRMRAAVQASRAAHPAAPVAQGAPRKVDIPPAGAPVADVCYADGWNQACDAFFGGLPPQEPLVVTIEKSAPVAQGDAKDPLAGAAQWLLQAIDGCNISDLQSHLKIGFNRAERLMQDALAARSQAKEGA